MSPTLVTYEVVWHGMSGLTCGIIAIYQQNEGFDNILYIELIIWDSHRANTLVTRRK